MLSTDPLMDHHHLRRFHDLFDRVKKLNAQFEYEFARKNDSSTNEAEYSKMLKYQDEFWTNHVNCIKYCNAVYMDNYGSPMCEKSKDCYKKILDFNTMVNLYKKEIVSAMEDLELRKKTILIGICDIEGFICGVSKSSEIEIDDSDEPPNVDTLNAIDVDQMERGEVNTSDKAEEVERKSDTMTEEGETLEVSIVNDTEQGGQITRNEEGKTSWQKMKKWLFC